MNKNLHTLEISKPRKTCIVSRTGTSARQSIYSVITVLNLSFVIREKSLLIFWRNPIICDPFNSKSRQASFVEQTLGSDKNPEPRVIPPLFCTGCPKMKLLNGSIILCLSLKISSLLGFRYGIFLILYKDR